MIAFATLLLGLIVGPQPVGLVVSDSVASADLLLDGNRVAVLDSSSWSTICDFGADLVPHELAAIAYDSEGKEIDRVVQWINLPRHPAETALALQGSTDGSGLVAHLAWESVVNEEPIRVSAWFDGMTVPVEDPRRIAIPDFDQEQLHHFRVELDFSNNVSSIAEVTFAGSYVDEVDTELTAVPVLLGKRTPTPSPRSLAGRFSVGSEKLKVVAVEEGPAEIVVVRDESARKSLNRLHRHDEEALWRRARGGKVSDRSSGRTRLPLPSGMKVRFLWPSPGRQQRSGYALDVFPPSSAFTSRDGGLFWLVTYVRRPYAASRTNRYADAVAAAGLLAAERDRRRAVVLLVGDGYTTQDTSQFSLSAAAGYLRSLRVPLYLWSTSAMTADVATAPGFVDVSSSGKLERAVRRLYEEIGRQRIVWLNGTHLPQRITLEEHGLALQQLR